MDNCPRSHRRSGVPGHPHTVQRVHLQLLPQQRHGILFREGPLLHLRSRAREIGCPICDRVIVTGGGQHPLPHALAGSTEPAPVRKQNLRRSHPRQLIQHQRPRRRSAELRRTKLTGRKIDSRHADARRRVFAHRRHTRQPLALAGLQRGVNGGAWRQHSRHLAPHDGLGELRVLHLLA